MEAENTAAIAKPPVPIIAKPAVPVKLELPSGSVMLVRQGFGRDLQRAQRAVVGGDPTSVVFALIAELAEFEDGRKLVYEDVLELPLADVLALQSEVVGKNFLGVALPSADRRN
jgi:hypothetical protein